VVTVASKVLERSARKSPVVRLARRCRHHCRVTSYTAANTFVSCIASSALPRSRFPSAMTAQVQTTVRQVAVVLHRAYDQADLAH
jgi:hypothetical protein